MIEIKLSQGAKPGHGGVLAIKNTEEVARDDVVSPLTISPSRKGLSALLLAYERPVINL